MRHGRAERASDSGDSGRCLSQEGRAEVLKIAERLRVKNLPLDAIVCSPLTRAVQSAEIAAHALGWRDRIVASEKFSPDSVSQDAYDVARALGENILVVSHESLVSRLCSMIAKFNEAYETSEIRGLTNQGVAWRLRPSDLNS